MKIPLGGEHFGLKSRENNYYLACVNNSTNVCLRPNPTDCVPVKVIERTSYFSLACTNHQLTSTFYHITQDFPAGPLDQADSGVI
ncbi:hypothetical protein FQN60_017964 [Etheostoma spectabile]|uniref:Uncharacterized protein n=1 Tax=Etheostoma spectabile TaxID=54343 RepID=A0A5J5DGY1_9PERO|nr:hypothetical protein FQN60_017964 [Etheostoma spectabile]